MTMLAAPKIDKRSAQHVFDESIELVRDRLSAEAPERDQMTAALLRVFARYCELIIQRLNRVPEKNYLAFLDTLNLSRIPPLPAQAPLSFTLVKKLPTPGTPVIVPARTKVAAAPSPGEEAPVVFETTRETALSDVRLEKIAALDPRADLWSDKTSLAGEEGASGSFVFFAETPVVHEFYVRHDAIFGGAPISRLSLNLELANSTASGWNARDVEWRIPGAKEDIFLTPLHDTTAGLSRSGEVVFADLPEWPEYDLYGRNGRWLACRLRQALHAEDRGAEPEKRRSSLLVDSIALMAHWQLDNRPVTAAYSTTALLDLTRDFYPFGERPRFNEVFYLASDAFAAPGSSITLNVTLTNPASGPRNRALPPVTKAGRPVIQWEYWNGKRWSELEVRDQTDAFTENGQVTFTLPSPLAPVTVNGQEAYWIRARLVAGNYGEDERLEFSESGGYRRVPSTLAPPSIQAIAVTSWLSAGPVAPEAIVTHNNLVLEDYSRFQRFVPFQYANDPRKTLYLGFKLPENVTADTLWQAALSDLSERLERSDFETWLKPIRFGERRGNEIRLIVPSEEFRSRVVHQFAALIEAALRTHARSEVKVVVNVNNPLAERAIDLYFHLRAPARGRAYLYDQSRQASPRLTWQYWNGKEWRDATVSDTTAALTVSGVITLRAGPDAMPWQQTSLAGDLYWFRVLWSAGEFGCMPDLTRLLMNTVLATQTLTLENELLGSSNGKPHQTFRTARRPVLYDLILEVKEPDVPGPDEAAAIEAAYGREAITPITAPQGGIEGAWVRWTALDNLLSSTHSDRHFVVDREIGQITFGDNIHGRIPPAGTNNVRLRRYQTGGGIVGNKPRGTIEQLRTTVPYVDRVINLEAAWGGQDPEPWDSVCERGSRWLRHRERAVTAEDYEDLAKLASPVIARAKCYPAQDRALDPLGNSVHRGMVSVAVVPRSSEARPQPDLELLRRVREFVSARSAADASLVVLSPEYVQLCVEADVVAQSAYMDAGVKARCEEKLSRFLHPLSGGEDGQGWDFGDYPHESDLYAQLEAVDGVGYVRSLRLRVEEDRPGLFDSGGFLISSGQHEIRTES
jgi:hypothetical protein